MHNAHLFFSFTLKNWSEIKKILITELIAGHSLIIGGAM